MVGPDYDVPNVKWTQYFTNEGHALHGNYWRDPELFGMPGSHGCVSMLDVGAGGIVPFGRGFRVVRSGLHICLRHRAADRAVPAVIAESAEKCLVDRAADELWRETIASKHVRERIRLGLDPEPFPRLHEVPAGPELYNIYDELLMHHRRYRMGDLQRLVRASGLEVVRASHLGALVYPAFYVVKRWNKRHQSRDALTKQQLVAGSIRTSRSGPFLNLALQMELAAGRFVNWPVGIRCLITGRKPG